MTDLYSLLDVSRDATTADIRTAYRRIAKDLHPDMPTGDAAAFARVKLAHDILTDPERRQRYDTTGDARETQPDNRASMIFAMISTALDEAINACAQGGHAPQMVDLVEVMGQIFAQRTQIIAQNIAATQTRVVAYEKLIGRFTQKKTADAANPLEQILAGKLAESRERLEGMTKEQELSEEARRVVGEYRFRQDVQHWQQAAQTYYLNLQGQNPYTNTGL